MIGALAERKLMRALTLSFTGLLVLAACDRKPMDIPARAPAAADPAATPAAPGPSPAAAISTPSGEFDAISNTAMSVTGSFTAAGGKLAFEQGQTYGLSGVSALKAADPYAATKASFASLINVPDAADLSVFKVVSEDPGQARNGGFCGKTPTTYLVAHNGVDGTGQPAYVIIAFSGAAPPSATSAETELCGTFMYAPRYD